MLAGIDQVRRASIEQIMGDTPLQRHSTAWQRKGLESILFVTSSSTAVSMTINSSSVEQRTEEAAHDTKA